MKNKTFAILAAPAAIPPKPNIPATIARIIKMTVQRNIMICFLVNKNDFLGLFVIQISFLNKSFLNSIRFFISAIEYKTQ